MSTAATLDPTLEISSEIAEVANQLGVSAQLPDVIAMTQRVFPDCPWHIEIDDDPEIANDRHLAIVVRDRYVDVNEAVSARWRWHEQLFAVCPAPLAHIFRIGMEYDG